MSIPLPVISANITSLSQCTLDLCPLEYAVLRYVPSAGWNLAFMSIFSLLLLAILGLSFLYRTLSFTISMCCGLILEIVGYWARYQMRFAMFEQGPFLINIICLSVAPVFFIAALYLCLSRVIVHYGRHNSILAPRTYTLPFIASDIIALILQAVGGALASSANTQRAMDVGENVMLVGLSFQVISLSVSMCLSTIFAWNVAVERKAIKLVFWSQGKFERPPRDVEGFKIFLAAFAAATVLILMRSIFRVAELAHGFKSSLANIEIAFMILEGGVTLVAVLLISVFHPGRYIGEGWKENGWIIGKKEVVVTKKVDGSVNGDERCSDGDLSEGSEEHGDFFMRPYPTGTRNNSTV